MKRVLDLILCLPILIAAMPLMLAIAVVVRWSMGSPVLFRQPRAGKNGAPFVLLKFRTMTHATDPQGRVLSDAERLTKFGGFLRSSSLDELPQLWCVVRGDMSLVGPRPLLMEYLPRYTSEQNRRHNVMPGITGWVQVNGRNSLSWEQKFELDTWYADHWSLALDLRILWMTVTKVLRRVGINEEGQATMREFMGTLSPGIGPQQTQEGEK